MIIEIRSCNLDVLFCIPTCGDIPGSHIIPHSCKTSVINFLLEGRLSCIGFLVYSASSIHFQRSSSSRLMANDSILLDIVRNFFALSLSSAFRWVIRCASNDSLCAFGRWKLYFTIKDFLCGFQTFWAQLNFVYCDSSLS